jgi:uncharacterized protein (TIGR00159 family)
MMEFLEAVRPVDILDVVVVAILIYRVLLLLKGTRAFQVLGGLMVLAAVYGFARALSLNTVIWIFEKFSFYLVVTLLILFQEDIRRALARVGNPLVGGVSRTGKLSTYQIIARVCFRLADQGRGALITVERDAALDELSDSATLIGGALSEEILVAIFQPTSPIHDGSVVVREDRLWVAAAFLPLTTRSDLKPHLGTRHRAALGITETTDCMVFVVSEERRAVSIAFHGDLYGVDSPDELRLKVQELLSMEADQSATGSFAPTRPKRAGSGSFPPTLDSSSPDRTRSGSDRSR